MSLNQTNFIRTLFKTKTGEHRISQGALEAIDCYISTVADQIMAGSRLVVQVPERQLVSRESVGVASRILGFSVNDLHRAETAVKCYEASRDSKKRTHSFRAKLTLSVARVRSRFDKKGGARVKKDAFVYLTGLLECVCARLLERCQDILQSDRSGRKTIFYEDVECVIAKNPIRC